MPRGRFYERFEIPPGASGVATTVHVHYDGERRQMMQDLLERAKRRPRWHTRDAEPQVPERLSHEEIQRDAKRRDQHARPRSEEDDVFFHNDRRDGWQERPHPRDRHIDALKQFRDALRRYYDQGGEDGLLAEFLAWVESHMSPGDWQAPRRDPNRMNVPSTAQYTWPDPKRFAKGYGLKTSAGEGDSSQTMTSGSTGFRDSAAPPRTVADLNALHRRHYAAKGPL